MRKFRLAALAVTTACVGALLSGTAGASEPSISFSGTSPLGLAALACGSDPDVTSVSIVAGGTVEVRNLTGHDATIYVNGAAESSLDSDSEAPVSFPAGTWTVALKPSCLLNLSDAGTATVVATADPDPAVAAPAAIAAATDNSPSDSSSGSSSSGSSSTATSSGSSADGSSAGSASSGSSSTDPQPKTASTKTKTTKVKATPQPVTATATTTATVSPTGSTPTGSTPTGSTPTDTTPTDTATTGTTSGSHRSTTGTATGTGSGSGTSSGTGSGTGGTGSGTSATDTTQTATGAINPAGDVSIGPAQALGTAASGANYLLVLVTLLGVLGVGTASVRAVLAQRSARRLLIA